MNAHTVQIELRDRPNLVRASFRSMLEFDHGS